MNYYVWLVLFSTLFSLPTYAAPAVDQPTKADRHNESGHRHDKGDKARADAGMTCHVLVNPAKQAE